jgi:hypothetical protein
VCEHNSAKRLHSHFGNEAEFRNKGLKTDVKPRNLFCIDGRESWAILVFNRVWVHSDAADKVRHPPSGLHFGLSECGKISVNILVILYILWAYPGER